MASTPNPIKAAVAVSNTTLYTAFVGAATRAMLVALDFCNTTAADITIDVFFENAAASVTRYFGKGVVVPANGVASWRGMQVIDTASDKWRAIASATGVDCTGTVVENV